MQSARDVIAAISQAAPAHVALVAMALAPLLMFIVLLCTK